MCAALLRPLLLILVLVLGGRFCLGDRPLLVFLIDGFRFDYMDELSGLPGFRELVETGVKVDYVTPEFPSLSYPNYYSLMTGRSCDIHQMTGNYMWDEVTMKEFLIGTNLDSRLPLWWDGSEPIWVTMQKKGKNVAMYYWPGCEVEILGVRPSFCEEYVYNPSLKNLTDSIEDALDNLETGKAEMAAIYYEKIDVEGHHFGPDSHQIKTAVRELDTALQMLNKKIKEKDLGDKLNVMLFSDHGMTAIQWMERVIELDQHINMSDIVKMMDRGVVVSLWPKHNKEQEVLTALSGVPNMRVYDRQNIPERFHYKGGKFVPPLTLVAEPGWFITENKATLPYWNNGTGTSGWQKGWHGYDNTFNDMKAFFLATGPDFKKGLQAGPIRAVDIYNLMCSTAGVVPLPNNGSWARVECLLSGAGPLPRPLLWSLLTTLLLALLLVSRYI
uniref:glycerophosphocholine cholinephosphodiesterase n=1 Tax=Gadus morhua TaxID=8049 RepID=A0A8C4Z6M5_GADMO